MLNQVSAEAVYSATYVENYLDGVENLPNELQRLISRMRELDVCYLARVREAAFYQQSCKRIGNDNPTKKARNILRMQQSLIAAQELGDEKMSLLQAILDQIEAKTRLLDQHFKNLDFGKEDAVQIENKEPPHHHQSAAGVTTTTTNSNNNNNNKDSNTGNILTNNERPPNKRARRARHDTFSGLESNSSHHQNDASATTAAAVATATASSAAAAVAATTAATPAAAAAPVEHVLRSSQVPSSATAAAAAATAAAAAAVVSTASTTAASTNNTSTSGGTTTNQKKTTTGKKKKRKAKQTAHAQKEATESPPRDEEPLIDPDEPTYCLCDQISYGEMIMCDNDLCPIEWFHFSCVTLTTKPKGKWYCPKCRGDRPNVMKPKALFLRELEKYNKDKEEKT